MVDRTDLGKVNELYYELGQITLALQNFDSGGRIASMIVVGASEDVPSAVVRTTEIEYPPTMVAAIKTALAARQQQISDELASLGLTGVSSP